jgi:glutamine synthetase
MSERLPSDRDGFAAWCEREGVRTVVVGGSDTHGIWRGKRQPVEDFLAGLERGVAVSDVIFVLPHADDAEREEEIVEPPPGHRGYFPRKDLGFPDAFLRADLTTARRLPWHEDTVGVLGTFHTVDDAPVPLDPRAVLSRLSERIERAGFSARFGVEFEFYVLRGDLRALRDRGWALDPLRPRPYVYAVHGASLDGDLLRSFEDALVGAGIEVEAAFPETGPGQFEINLRHQPVARAADDAFLYKHAVKEVAAAHGLMATFMAKPHGSWAGSSCHLHQSLEDEGARPVFGDPNGGLSQVGLRWIGGLLETMRELVALLWPTPNSYKRNVPYSWAGTTVSWGIDNRTTGLRAIVGSPGVTRIEHRVPGADVNPYLAIAACLAGGLYGLEERSTPPDPFDGDAYASESLERLPRSLDEAIEALDASKVAREILGTEFVDHFVAMKAHEAELARRQVSPWEISRYVEMT